MNNCLFYFVLEPLTDEDYKKLERIMESGLMAAETSREKRKERVKKYLNWVR